MFTYSQLEAEYTKMSKKAERLIDHMKRNVKTIPNTTFAECEETVKRATNYLRKIETEVTRRSKLN